MTKGIIDKWEKEWWLKKDDRVKDLKQRIAKAIDKCWREEIDRRGGIAERISGERMVGLIMANLLGEEQHD